MKHLASSTCILRTLWNIELTCLCPGSKWEKGPAQTEEKDRDCEWAVTSKREKSRRGEARVAQIELLLEEIEKGKCKT